MIFYSSLVAKLNYGNDPGISNRCIGGCLSLRNITSDGCLKKERQPKP